MQGARFTASFKTSAPGQWTAWILNRESCICANRHIRSREFASALLVLVSFAVLTSPTAVGAQEIEPRVYANIPVGMNFLAVDFSYSSGNAFMDPSLPIENLDVGLNIVLARYIRSFNLFGAPAKFKAVLPWSSGRWDTGYGQGGQTFVGGEPRNTKQKN